MSTARAAEAGVTLVEMLIALFLIAIMATAGAVMLTQSLRGTQMVDSRGSDANRVQSMLLVIRNDLAAFANRPSRPDGAPGPATRFEGYPVRFDGQILTLVRNGWAKPDETQLRSDLQRVEYRFQDGNLVRRSWSAPDAGPGTLVAEQQLMSNLETISVRYGKAQVWQDDWIVPAASTDTPLPDKVEFTFEFSEGDALTAKFLVGLRQ